MMAKKKTPIINASKSKAVKAIGAFDFVEALKQSEDKMTKTKQTYQKTA